MKTQRDGNYLKKELYELIKTDESIFDFIQESAMDGLWYWDIEYPENEWMNAKFWTVLGYDPTEMPHKSRAWQNLINQDDLKVALDNFNKHCENPNHLYDQIVRFTHKSGSIVWIHCRGMAIRDKDGKPVRMLGVHNDVTEIKKADEIENKLRSIIKTIPDLLFHIDSTGKFLSFYQEHMYEELYTKKINFVGKTIYDVFDSDFANEAQKKIKETLKNGNTNWEYQLFEDEPKFYQASLSKLNNNEIIVISRDITEQKKTEQTLKESEEKYRHFFEDDLTGDFILNEKGVIIECNHSLVEILGYDNKAELIGQYVTLLYSDLSEFERIKKELLNKKFLKNYETVRKKKNGELINIIENKVADFDREGKLKEIKGYLYDITDRKKAELALRKEEQKYRNFFEDDLSGDFILNIEGVIVECNHSFVEILGYDNKDELIGQNITVLYLDLSEFEKIREELLNKKFLRNYETIRKKKNGDLIHIIENKVADFDNEGKLKEIKGYLYDITDRKKAELAIKESEQKLKESNLTKDKFFSIIAHDLKNPFASMLGLSDLLLKNYNNYDKEKQMKLLNFVHNDLKTTYELLENLLTWSRSQRQRLDFNPERINLYQLVDKTIEVLHQMAVNKSIKIVNNVTEDIFALADVNMLSTIIRNLISNAIKYSYKGGQVLIDVDTTDNDSFVNISVKDNGIGIPGELQAELFDISRENSTKGTENEKGTGLGLILCQEFIQRHGGKIWVESESGKGSDFKFTVPLFLGDS